jgi:hypothetical protein
MHKHPLWLILGSTLAAPPAVAQDIDLKPLAEARLRYETVDQGGLSDDAEALTIRVRSGIQASSGPLTAIVEMQGTLALVGDYYDGLHGAATRPLVADPQDIALYRAQLQYRTKAIALTLGRQRIALDDERFVGAVPFRDNGQSFDAARVEWTGVKGLKADVTYAWRVNTIWGIDGAGARPRSIGGNNLLGNLSYASPIGTLTGFAYLVDQDEAAVQGFRLSSQTYGGRLAGVRPLGKGVRFSYQLSYATQSNYDRNPNRYRAEHHLIDAAVEAHGIKLGAGYEVLGADRGVALTSFQTPIATGFKFQGWADKFLTTPPDGVRDLYASLGYGWKQLGPFKGLALQAVYHRFASDRLVRLYGDEVDLLATAKLGKTSLSARYADFQTRTFATDTRKFWLQLDWTL